MGRALARRRRQRARRGESRSQQNLAFIYPDNPNDPLDKHLWGLQVKSVRAGAVVESSAGDPLKGNAALDENNLYVIEVDDNGKQTFIDKSGNRQPILAGVQLCLVEIQVTVYWT